MTTRQLGASSRYWIKRLHLEHWSWDIGFANQKDLLAEAHEWVYGRTWPDLDDLKARVRIFQQKDVNVTLLDIMAEGDVDACQEKTLIHELLHIRLDPASTLSCDSAFESGLNRLADILYETRYPAA